MNKLLRPERFDGGDAIPGGWEHWFTTFTNFVTSITDPAPDKLKLLVNYVTPSVYSHIKDYTTYDEAVKALQAVYVKPVNQEFARHQLATRKQQPHESIDQFLQQLKLLSKDCGFAAVTASVYAQESVWDAFITGISSSAIRQRLLEKESLSLDEAIQHARSLELAQRNAECYPSSSPTILSAASDTSPAQNRSTTSSNPGGSGSLCFTSLFQRCCSWTEVLLLWWRLPSSSEVSCKESELLEVRETRTPFFCLQVVQQNSD